jgi:hypothetical protein
MFMGMKWKRDTSGGSLTAQGLVALLGLFAGLCAIFAAIVSAAEAYREQVQASWPKANARIQECSVEPYEPFRSDGSGTVWHIECAITYALSAEEVATQIRSRSTPHGANIALLDQWVADHPRLTPIVVRYDPSNHKNAIPAGTDMPYTGPRTPQNLKLLLIFSAGCVGLLTIARVMRRRSDDVGAMP